MEQLLNELLIKMQESNLFTISQMDFIKMALVEISEGYKVTLEKYQLVPSDYLMPNGYKEYFANKIMAGLSEETLKQYKYQIDRFLAYIKKPINDISSADIAMYVHRLRVINHNSATTANNTIRYLSSFFTWLSNNEFIAKNPMANVSSIKEPIRLHDNLTPEDFERIMKSITNQRNRAIIAVLAGSGVRRAELASMELSRLNLTDGVFTVIGKGNRERTCFLTPRAKYELANYLKTRRDDSPYVFVKERFPYAKMSPEGVTHLINKIGNDVGVKIHPHMFRHFFADNAHNANIDVLDISRLLGHASVNTTQIYIAENTHDLAYKHSKIR